MNYTVIIVFHIRHIQKTLLYNSLYMVSQVIHIYLRIRILLVYFTNTLVVTENVCNQKDISNNQPNNPLREFCSPDINSDVLLDLIARFSDYHKKTSSSEPACLYYGLTSRKLKLQNNKGTALGKCEYKIFFFRLILEFCIIRMVMERTSLQ